MKSKTTVYESSLESLKNIAQDVFKGADVTVILFGSRARGDYFETSDVDVGILPKGEMNKSKISLFREKIENSNIPYKVDVLNLSQASREFSDKVLKEGLLIWRS
ncbi:MAG: nucleotidyltransferase domain-containing protein [Dehalococcoidia bacterium]|nr:nucleotidyltransferase domain-containing protein [Dehalococcoidia bacterium]